MQLSPIYDKTLSKVGIKGTFPNTIKAIYDKPSASIIFHGQKLHVLPLRSGMRQRCPLSPLLIQHSTGSLNHSITKGEIKSIQIGKEEVKLSLFADDIILYIQNSKDSSKKFLELINEFSKVAGYKINIQKSVAFLYANSELTEREIKTISFTIAPKRIKYLGINLTKDVKDLYLENYKTLRKKLKKIQISGSIYHVHG